MQLSDTQSGTSLNTLIDTANFQPKHAQLSFHVSATVKQVSPKMQNFTVLAKWKTK